jgi:hypothetical protein
VALFMVISFDMRFFEQRYAMLGAGFAVAGTAVLTTSLQLGFARAMGTATSTAATLAASQNSSMLPFVLASCAWGLALFAFVMNRKATDELPPIRLRTESAHHALTSSLLVGYVGVVLIVLAAFSFVV